MEFKSKLEELTETKELFFNATPGFGEYNRFLGHAAAHPAKINMKLLAFLIENFTNPGDVVLDPMCGTGSTGVVSALRGRDAICVDLEQKFVDWAEEAKRKVQDSPSLALKGSIVNLCGDARKLSELLNETDVVVTSPPYSEGIGHVAGENASMEHEARVKLQRRYTEQMSSKGNIGSLKHGNIDTVVTSLPYSGSITGTQPEIERRAERMRKAGYDPKTVLGGYARVAQIEWRYAERENKGNIGNLPHGEVAAVITSPPYADMAKSKEGAISPHMQGLISKLSGIPVKEFAHNVDKLKEAVKIAQSKVPFRYSVDPSNIGNLRRETYLEAMLKVYREMFKVLKLDGTAVIVVKPFIRAKAVVDLPWQTWLLLQKAGFKLAQVYKLRLRQESFWRVIYRKKYPKVPKIAHEYILIVKKV